MAEWTLITPRLAGSYSLDEDHTVRVDRSNAKFLHRENIGRRDLNIDLDEGFEDHVPYQVPHNVALNALCRWIMSRTPAGSNLKQALRGVDVVSPRCILSKISVSTFSTNRWAFMAMKKDGIIFIKELECTDRERASFEHHSSYWGHKFEQFMQTDRRGGHNLLNEPIRNEEFRAVVTSRLNSRDGSSFGLLISGKVDAVDKNGNFVELKTQKDRLRESFWMHKSRDIYMQCKLLGVKDLVIGFRDKKGILQKVEGMRVERLVRSGDHYWSYEHCLGTLGLVLTTVKDKLQDNEMCDFEFDGKAVTYGDVVPAKDDFLSQEFKDHFNLA